MLGREEIFITDGVGSVKAPTFAFMQLPLACLFGRLGRAFGTGNASGSGLQSVLPGECHRLSELFLVDRGKSDGRAALSAPRTTRGLKRLGLCVHEILLLLWRELDHAVESVRVQGREDPSVGAKIRMAHVCIFSGAVQAQRDAAKLFRSHCL